MSSWVNLPEIVTALVVAAVTAMVTLAWHRMTKNYRRFGWSVLYDEPVNQGDPLPDPKNSSQNGSASDNTSDRARQREMWKIIYESDNRGISPYEVMNGSLVVVEMRNIGTLPIRDSNFDGGKITCQFPGRKVVHFKIRDNDEYRDKVLSEPSRMPVPGQSEQFELPATQLNIGESFKVLVLLESKEGERPQQDEKPEVKGGLAGSAFATYGGRGLRRLWPWIAAGGALVAAAGVMIGFWSAASGNTPQATCVTGSLDIEGSTAFAPIMNQAVTDYEQQCTQANITMSAGGSVDGWHKLQNSRGGTPVLAMYDGDPGPLPSGYSSQPAGIVIFAMVGNQSLSAKPDYAHIFRTGMSDDGISNTFRDPKGAGFAAVGRSEASGSRAAFVQNVLNGPDWETGKSACPPAGSLPSGLCLEDTTMHMLAYIDQTADAIGYAESDAVPFFPDVRTIPISGHEPTRANVLDGSYTFDATEHLYLKGNASPLAADLIAFLTSKAESARLSSNAFIPCQDLGGSQVADACDN